MNNRWLTAGVKVFNEGYWYSPTVSSSIKLYLFSSTFFYIFYSPLLNTFWFLWLWILFSRFYSTFEIHSNIEYYEAEALKVTVVSKILSYLGTGWRKQPEANALIGDGKGKQPTKKLQHAGRYLGKGIWRENHIEPWVSFLLIHLKPSEYWILNLGKTWTGLDISKTHGSDFPDFSQDGFTT